MAKSNELCSTDEAVKALLDDILAPGETIFWEGEGYGHRSGNEFSNSTMARVTVIVIAVVTLALMGFKIFSGDWTAAVVGGIVLLVLAAVYWFLGRIRIQAKARHYYRVTDRQAACCYQGLFSKPVMQSFSYGDIVCVSRRRDVVLVSICGPDDVTLSLDGLSEIEQQRAYETLSAQLEAYKHAKDKYNLL